MWGVNQVALKARMSALRVCSQDEGFGEGLDGLRRLLLLPCGLEAFPVAVASEIVCGLSVYSRVLVSRLCLQRNDFGLRFWRR